MKNLQGKVVAITGAGSGMGRSLAYQLADKGAHLALNDFNAQTLAETTQVVKDKGAQVSTHVFDVSQKDKMYAFAKDAIATHGQVDIIINNAGLAISPTSVVDLTDEEISYVLNVNLWGVIHGTKAFLPHLLTRPSAAVVNISSVFGMVGIMGQAPYCMSKYAVRGFSESLRMELLDTKVNVVQVHPGGIDTNIVRNSRFKAGENREESAKKFAAMAHTSSEDAARQIIQGIEKKKYRVLIGKDARQIDIIQRLFPTSYVKRIRSFLIKGGFEF